MIREMQFGFKKQSREGVSIYTGGTAGARLGASLFNGETGRMRRDDFRRSRLR
jgi:hypothetical protein